MAHYPEQRWLFYVQDRLEESERLELEEHLAVCEVCLMLYMEQLEQVSVELPDSVQGSGMVNQVMYRLTEPSRRRQATSSSRLRILHYTVAAAITLLLMTSGVFDSMISTGAHEPAAPPSESISSQVMEKALSLFELFDPQGGNQP